MTYSNDSTLKRVDQAVFHLNESRVLHHTTMVIFFSVAAAGQPILASSTATVRAFLPSRWHATPIRNV